MLNVRLSCSPSIKQDCLFTKSETTHQVVVWAAETTIRQAYELRNGEELGATTIDLGAEDETTYISLVPDFLAIIPSNSLCVT